MASKRIELLINGKNNAKSALNSASSDVKKLASDVKTAGNNLTMQTGFNKITTQAKTAVASIKSAFSGLSGAITSLLAGVSLSNMVSTAAAIEAKWTVVAANTGVATSALSTYKTQLYEISQQWGTDNSDASAALTVIAQKYGNINTAMSYMNGLAATSILTGQSQVDIANALYKAETGNLRTLKNTVLTIDQFNRYAEDGELTQEEIGQILAENEIRAQGYTDTAAAGINRMNNAVSKLYAGFVITLVPAIELIANGISTVAELFQGLPTPLKTVVTYITAAALAVASIGAPLAIASPLITTMASGASKLATGIASATTKLWAYVVAAKAADKADDGVGVSSGTSTGSITGTLKSWGSTIASGVAALWATIAATTAGAGALSVGTAFAALATVAWSSWEQGLAHKAVDDQIFNPTRHEGTIGQWFVDLAESAKKSFQSGLSGLINFDSIGKSMDDLKNWIRASLTDAAISAAFGNIGASAQNAAQQVYTAFATTASQGAHALYSAAQQAYNYIRGGVTGVQTFLAPTLNSVYSSAKTLYNYVSNGASGIVRIFSSGISSIYSAVTSLYNTVRAGASGVVSIVSSIISGPGGPRGPGGPEDLSYKYENYGGWQKNAWTGSNSLSGNCADMTAGLIGRYGGSYVSGTWNGNPHVWYKSPSGKEYDPARKALNGTFSPPPRGPSGSGGGVTFDLRGATILDGPSFERTMDKYMNKHLG